MSEMLKMSRMTKISEIYQMSKNKVNTLRGSPQSLSLCKYVKKNLKPAMQHKIDWLRNTVCAKIMKMHSKIEHLLHGKR